jgi:YfiH family protein
MKKFKKIKPYKFCLHGITQKDPTAPCQGSLALHTHEPSSKILHNRSQLQKQFPTMKFVVANQTHSDNIAILSNKESLGWQDIESAIENCDALITNQSGVMLTILTADCVPILLLDPIQKVVAAIHAGWRGTEQKILLKTVQKMQEQFDSNPEDIIAGIAPAIGRCCYEVDEEVAKHFLEYPKAIDHKEANKYMLDLPSINHHQLLHAGLKKEHIEDSNICTACEVDHYFSYREEQGCSGRFMSMIGLVN